MNSLNIITTRVSPSSTPVPSRSNSLSNIGIGIAQNDENPVEKHNEPHPCAEDMESYSQTSLSEAHYDEKLAANEETPLLSENKESNVRAKWWHRIPRTVASSIISSIRWVIATLAAPGVYLISCFYDSDGYFLPWSSLKGLFGLRKGGKDRATPESYDDNEQLNTTARESERHSTASRPTLSSVLSSSSSPSISSESENDESSVRTGRHTRSKSLETDDTNTTRKSIRIKLSNDEALEKRKHRKTQSAVARTKASDLGGDELSAHLKSPTSPIAALTKYPRTPAPPRPLIPRRQPSYINFEPSRRPQKTLILDLDETLIHSMSKGGRSTGHMVEVRLNTASLGMRGSSQVGQHPILYWVNKRPYCDDFLRRVSKWFNLVVFTASVQEYADPVIDWLEQERKYFSARYYRQHCTYRQGAYIKDLSSVEPDLSNVMILDNSPLSYLFHEDNAIPIQGWINDPTDYDLMNIVPLLEGLQYVHDVRALLALRGGEEGRNAA